MAATVREAACWVLLTLMSARLLTTPDQLSTEQLLLGASYAAGLLAFGWLLWCAFALYFLPYNRVRVSTGTDYRYTKKLSPLYRLQLC